MREAYISDAERNGAAVAAVRDHLHWAISTSQELSVSYHGWRDLLDPAWEPWAETWQRFAGADALAAATKIVDRLLAEHGEPEDSGSADEDADLLDELDALAPLAQWKWAEELAAQALRSCGYEDAECTPPGADGGLDAAAG